jgi:hypothetical protein
MMNPLLQLFGRGLTWHDSLTCRKIIAIFNRISDALKTMPIYHVHVFTFIFVGALEVRLFFVCFDPFKSRKQIISFKRLSTIVIIKNYIHILLDLLLVFTIISDLFHPMHWRFSRLFLE